MVEPIELIEAIRYFRKTGTTQGAAGLITEPQADNEAEADAEGDTEVEAEQEEAA